MQSKQAERRSSQPTVCWPAQWSLVQHHVHAAMALHGRTQRKPPACACDCGSGLFVLTGMIFYSKLIALFVSLYLTLKINVPPSGHLDPLDGDTVADLYLGAKTIDRYLKWPLVFVVGLVCYSLLRSSFQVYAPWTTLELLGFGMNIGGCLLRLWSFASLGRLFTFEVGFRREHPLVCTGPYRYLMHPSYTGALAAGAGFQIWLGWAGHVFFWIPMAVLCYMLIFKRIPNEEAAMRARFTEQVWNGYQRKRWRLFPLIY